MKTIMIDDIIGGWGMEGRDIREQLEAASGEDIKVEISSPGGFVWDGIEIFNLLKNYTGHVTTHLMGLAASMASYIALAGDKITAESNAVFMIHDVSIYARGNYKTMRKAGDVAEGLSSLLAKEYASRAGLPLSDIRQLMNDETFYYGDEIKTAGFVDEIIQSDKHDTKNDAVAFANLQIDECILKMKSIENEKNDFEKAAAMIDLQNVSGEKSGATVKVQTPATGAGYNKKSRRSAIMNIETLKAEHPDLYQEIFQAGIENERGRIKAHMEWMEIAPDAVGKAIAEGEDFTMAHLSAYNKAGLNKNDLKNRDEDNPENIETPEAIDEKEVETNLVANVLAFSKKKEA